MIVPATIDLRPALFMVDDNDRVLLKELARAWPERVEDDGRFLRWHDRKRIGAVNRVTKRFGYRARLSDGQAWVERCDADPF